MLDLSKMTPIDIYRRGFEDGALAKDNHTISLLGYDISKLIEIIQDWESRQPKLLYKLERDWQTLEVYKHDECHVVLVNGKIIFKSWGA